MSRIPRWRTSFALVAVGSAAMAGIAAPVQAAPPEGPGQCKTFDDPQWSGWTDHAELGKALRDIESTSAGRVRVQQVGASKQGRELWSARVGTGPRVLMVQSAIHGNERTGTEALLGILKDLGTSRDAATEQLLSSITLVALPMVNPDGGELNRRMNVVPWDQVVADHPQLAGAPTAWYHSPNGDGIDQPGFDLNRDFNPDLDYVPRPEDLPGRQVDAGFFLSPESRTIRDTYLALRAEFGAVDAVVDLHHMGPCGRTTGGPQDGKLISVALDYPPLGVNDGAAYQEQYPLLDQDKSRRYALSVARGIQAAYGSQSPLVGVGRYLHPQEREYAGQGRSAFALNGSATVLFEVRGQQDDLGQKQKGMLIQSVRTGVESLIAAMASGEVDRLNGDEFFALPDYGWDTTATD
ncbi:zinc carboxypeptidase [Saccharopolyspora indica]|uniref:M14 family zinc carboxypeptidase n=1 Tax=Saccharopolyspora indica TaxID=1229659 RepID=UPI0022EA902E|nr:M14 family zinc carboxypeptidase [Saccharopolyspora indica]MDA3648350.1 M14 family zinc carboxypeptidase [Saccharopolyspora indica]